MKNREFRYAVSRPMAFEVFISYAAQDKVVADAACARLEAAGIRCWIAPRDVSPGAVYGAAIINAIDQCRVMVLIFSAHANGSMMVGREIERAVSKGKSVLPLRIEDVAPSGSLEFFIGAVHWLDALTPPLEQHLGRLANAIKILLPDTAAQQAYDGVKPASATDPRQPDGPATKAQPEPAVAPARQARETDAPAPAKPAKLVQARPLRETSSPTPAGTAPTGWRRSSAMLVILAGPALLAVTTTLPGTIGPFLARAFGLTPGDAPLISTVLLIGVAVGGAVSGFVIERRGVRGTLILALLAYAGVDTVNSFIEDAGSLMAVQFLLGLAAAHIVNCCQTLLGLWFDDAGRARMLGYQAAVAAAAGVAVSLSGPAAMQSGGWRMTSTIYYAALPVLGLTLAAIRPRDAIGGTGGGLQAGGPLRPLYLLAFGLFFVNYVMVALLPSVLLALRETANVSVSGVAATINAKAVVGGILAAFFGLAYTRLGRRRTRLLLIGLLALGFAVIGLAEHYTIAGLGAVICGVGSIIMPYFVSLVIERTSPGRRSRALGFVLTTAYAANLLAVLTVLPIRAQLPFAPLHADLFLVAAGVLLIGMLATWRVGAMRNATASAD